MRTNPTFAARVFLLLAVAAGLSPELPAQPREDTVEYVLERYVQAMGGRAAIERIRSVRLNGTVSFPNGAQHTITVLKKKPNLVRVSVDTGTARFIQGYNGEDAWFARQAGNRTFHDRMRGEAAAVFIREAPLENLLVNPRDTGVVLQLGPDRSIGRVECYQVIATLPNGARFVHLIDKAEMRDRRILEYRQDGTLISELVPSRFENFGGVTFALQIVRLSEGETVSTLVIDEVQLNIGVLDNAFAPPGVLLPDLPPEDLPLDLPPEDLPPEDLPPEDLPLE